MKETTTTPKAILSNPDVPLTALRDFMGNTEQKLAQSKGVPVNWKSLKERYKCYDSSAIPLDVAEKLQQMKVVDIFFYKVAASKLEVFVNTIRSLVGMEHVKIHTIKTDFFGHSEPKMIPGVTYFPGKDELAMHMFKEGGAETYMGRDLKPKEVQPKRRRIPLKTAVA